MNTGAEQDNLQDNNSNIDLEDSTTAFAESNATNARDISDNYKFGWSNYSEITNGRFAMIGFLAIILIELFSQQSFLKWAGIL